MATITANNIKKKVFQGGAPYGTYTAYGPFNLTTSAAGVFTASNDTTAVVQADVVRLGILPAGMTLFDAIAYVSNAFSANVDFAVGFLYTDGVDSTVVPQDADFFTANWDAGTVGVYRKDNGAPPVKLPKDAYLVVTVSTANCAEVGIMDLYVMGDINGPA